jgi:hypothetical protein
LGGAICIAVRKDVDASLGQWSLLTVEVEPLKLGLMGIVGGAMEMFATGGGGGRVVGRLTVCGVA